MSYSLVCIQKQGSSGSKSTNLSFSSHIFPASEYRPGRSSASYSLVKSISTAAGASNIDTGTRLSTGSHVALLVAQCLQREANWQVTFGCLNIIYMQDLIATVQSTLISSVVIAWPLPDSRHFIADILCIADGRPSPADGFELALCQKLYCINPDTTVSTTLSTYQPRW